MVGLDIDFFKPYTQKIPLWRPVHLYFVQKLENALKTISILKDHMYDFEPEKVL